MSHFSSLKTQLAEREHLLKALQDLGYVPEEGDVLIRGYAGHYQHADIRIPTRDADYDIGFRKVGESYECVADWEVLEGLDPHQFLRQVTQRYAYHACRANLEQQGFAVSSEETQQDGAIHLVLRRVT